MLPVVGSVIKPVEATDAFEAEQIAQRDYPGAVTAPLGEKVTGKLEIQRLFIQCLKDLIKLLR